MADNKRNVDTDDLSKPSEGDASATGTGTHARNRREGQAATKDNTASGAAGRKAGDAGGELGRG